MKFMKLGSRPGEFHSDGDNRRFLRTELASDIVIIVGDVKFYLHKFPLLSKCGWLKKSIDTSEKHVEGEVFLPDFPGGVAAFEICAKFCYSMAITLNARNSIPSLRAATYLEMTESVEKGNLVNKLQIFINSCLLRGWKDSISLLRTTSPGDSALIDLCVDSIASKICADTSRVSDERISHLDIDLFKKVIAAVKSRRIVSPTQIGEALRSYTYGRVAGFADGVIRRAAMVKNRSLVEEIIKLIPRDTGSVSCKFLLRLLRAASVLECSEERKKKLVEMAGKQIGNATAVDLLIPAPEKEKTLFDLDLLECIFEESLKHSALSAKLLDSVLSEIAVDLNVSLSKFIQLAEMIPGEEREVHDELYRAVDLFLKERPWTSKREKMKLCGLLDCRKLSLLARTHAVQNERLPLRVLVRLLLFNSPPENGSSSADSDLTSARSTGQLAWMSTSGSDSSLSAGSSYVASTCPKSTLSRKSIPMES